LAGKENKMETHPLLAPVIYIPHGGGPLPLLGDPDHAGLVDFLRGIRPELGQPAAVLVVSAHWEATRPAITSGATPPLLYDYYGFPPESYAIQYPAAGQPELAQRVYDLLTSAGFSPHMDGQRGFDHGVFVPLKLMLPEADIPCIQLSQLASLDPASHIALGKALAALRQENVLIVGSGMSFHNLRAFFASRSSQASQESLVFDRWLVETCTSPALSLPEREARLTDWEGAPYARFCHPREDHLLPLHVCFGAAAASTPAARAVFSGDVMGQRVSALLW
jgi:aromatic ring-opening dioxygenase catalytic subunit (LigB family)